MAKVHRIRLHGPWEVRTAQGAIRIAIPWRVRDGEFSRNSGPITFRRSFGQPTNLDAHERVWLVVESIHPGGDVSLNGERLGRIDCQGRFDITTRVRERNELIVEIDAVDDDCGITGEVVLEIAGGP